MRILALTAGASGMYCGSCMLDNALAAELIRQKHDVILLPVYTQTRTDAENVSYPRIFFNGVSVYFQTYFPKLRRLPAFVDRLLDSRWLLKIATARSIRVEPKELGELTVAMLEGRNGKLQREFDKLVGWLKTQPAPDVISLPYSLLISMAQPLKEVLHCPVVCTLQGEDIFLQSLIEPYRSESLALIRASVEHVDVFIASCEYYSDFMSEHLSIPAEKIHVVPHGINLEGHAPARAEDGTFRIGFLARVAPEKGLHLLAEAYCRLRRQGNPGPAMLEVAGYLGPEHREYLRQVERTMRENGLEREFKYHGELDRPAKIRFLQSLDVLSVPSTCDEPKGLSVLEAMANGVPVIQPRRGSYPEIIERTKGGLLVEPDSAEAITEALLMLWQDDSLRKRFGSQGYTGVKKHHSIERMAEATVEIYRNLKKETGT